MTDFNAWLEEGARRGWAMPAAPKWKRLPIIRHIRTHVLAIRVGYHNKHWRSVGLIPTGYDEWVLFGIWHGQEVEP